MSRLRGSLCTEGGEAPGWQGAKLVVIIGLVITKRRPIIPRRIFAALPGPRRLIMVPGAGHNGSLRSEVWPEIEHWIENAVKP